MYKLYHFPSQSYFYFKRKPTIADMIRITKRRNYGYKFRGNKLISVEGGIEAEWLIKEEFGISKIKFED